MTVAVPLRTLPLGMNITQGSDREFIARHRINELKKTAKRQGQLLNYDALASDLGRSRQTIANYVHYLESAFLIRLLYNYSGGFITSAKRARKVYPAHPCLVLPLTGKEMDPETEGMLMENPVVNETDCEFFYRTPAGGELMLFSEQTPEYSRSR